MKPLMSIYTSHDSSLTIRTENGEFHILEFERLLKKRFGRVDTREDYKSIYDSIKLLLKNEYNIDKIETCYYLEDNLPAHHKDYLKETYGIKEFIPKYHHISHAASAFYQSSFDESLIISYDGGGFDGGEGSDRVTFFNIYHAKRNGEIKRLKYIPYDLGTAYGMLALPIADIAKTEENWGEKFLGLAGKLMGYVALGKVRQAWLEPIKIFYKEHKHIALADFDKSLNKALGFKLGVNTLTGQDAYDFAATAQLAFEEIALQEIIPFIEQYKLPICLTGGCALNVLLNQRLRNMFDLPVFVPPNPSDCGLSLGMILLDHPSIKPVDITYSGFPILDKDILGKYVFERNAQLTTVPEIAKLLSEGKIIAVMRGNSECGPRALGNRSLLCDPSVKDRKDTLNKIKYREWWRPTAPIVKLEDVNKYFHMTQEASFMSFAPKVRTEWKDKLPAIVHFDDTGRVQTVSKEQNHYVHDIINEFEKLSGFGVLINTSFNVHGKPILTTIEDALEVLDTTEIDGVVIEDYLFIK